MGWKYPNKLHLVVLHNEFTSDAAETIYNFLLQDDNRSEVTLWGYKHAFSKLRDAFLLKDKPKTSEQITLKYGLDGLSAVHYVGSCGPEGTLYLRDISELPPLSNPTPVLMRQHVSYPEAPTFEDLVGLWAVYEHGGVYLDAMAIRSFRPHSYFLIERKADIAFAENPQRAGINRVWFSNMLVAAPPKSESVRSLCAKLAQQDVETPSSIIDIPQAGLGLAGVDAVFPFARSERQPSATMEPFMQQGNPADQPLVSFEPDELIDEATGMEQPADMSIELAAPLIQPFSSTASSFTDGGYDDHWRTVIRNFPRKQQRLSVNEARYVPVRSCRKSACELVMEWVLEKAFFAPIQEGCQTHARYIIFDDIMKRYTLDHSRYYYFFRKYDPRLRLDLSQLDEKYRTLIESAQ